MTSITYLISEEIFEKEPEYVRIVVVARIKNSGQRNAYGELERSLKEVAANYRNADPINIPQIKRWREAFKNMGINPSSFRPSFEALLRRAVSKPESIKSINNVVDMGNALALKHLVGVGVHPISQPLNEIILRFANGGEAFLDFTSEMPDVVGKGETILTHNGELIARHWIWRQSKSSMITEETLEVFINIDCLPPICNAQLEEIIRSAVQLLGQYCECAFSATHILNRSNPGFKQLM